MKRSTRWIGFLVIGSWIFPASVSAEAGRTALGILTRMFTARGAGIGETLTADDGSLDSMAFNPAGMAKLEKTQMSATYQRGLADDNFGYVNFGTVLPFGSLFASAGYLDAGTIELNLSDGTTGSRRAQQDAVGSIGLALGRQTPFSVGIVGKGFRSELAEMESASGFAADAGLFWQTPLSFLALGASIQNVGSDIQYDQTDDELPTVARYGLRLLTDQNDNVKWKDIFRNRYALYVDGVKMKEEEMSANVGIEISKRMEEDNLLSHAALRAGYIESTHAPTAGLGFSSGLMTIDYGVNFVDSFDIAHRVTISVHFSKNEKKSKSEGAPKLRQRNVFSN